MPRVVSKGMGDGYQSASNNKVTAIQSSFFSHKNMVEKPVKWVNIDLGVGSAALEKSGRIGTEDDWLGTDK